MVKKGFVNLNLTLLIICLLKAAERNENHPLPRKHGRHFRSWFLLVKRNKHQQRDVPFATRMVKEEKLVTSVNNVLETRDCALHHAL